MRGEALKGHIDTMLLAALRDDAQHGYALVQLLKERSGGVFELGEGTVYPALHRLEEKGWISAAWGTTENNRRARFYSLTARGRQQLTAESNRWAQLVAAVGRVMEPAP